MSVSTFAISFFTFRILSSYCSFHYLASISSSSSRKLTNASWINFKRWSCLKIFLANEEPRTISSRSIVLTIAVEKMTTKMFLISIHFQCITVLDGLAAIILNCWWWNNMAGGNNSISLYLKFIIVQRKQSMLLYHQSHSGFKNIVCWLNESCQTTLIC